MLQPFLDVFALDLSRFEVYGLFFLLGSFAVATLSDIKHMSAQREFMDVWWIVAAALAVIQLWQAEFSPTFPLVVKWVLVVLFGVLSHRAVGLWLRLATADVAACVAAAMLLSPGLVVVFFLLLKILAWPLSRVLGRGKPAYPFMPVVSLATVALLAAAFLTGLVDP